MGDGGCVGGEGAAWGEKPDRDPKQVNRLGRSGKEMARAHKQREGEEHTLKGKTGPGGGRRRGEGEEESSPKEGRGKIRKTLGVGGVTKRCDNKRNRQGGEKSPRFKRVEACEKLFHASLKLKTCVHPKPGITG